MNKMRFQQTLTVGSSRASVGSTGTVERKISAPIKTDLDIRR